MLVLSLNNVIETGPTVKINEYPPFWTSDDLDIWCMKTNVSPFSTGRGMILLDYYSQYTLNKASYLVGE